ncbi:unnamed protein product [Caenorhabditis bovis]|uniref:Uncharacterized protein n=1 Tax=Caenorhabditis bovis TaxID=2654633 RepID=A0A8S1EKQ7_9PELO|nr:unnamed protein product [Caenorhabditis bovis]
MRRITIFIIILMFFDDASSISTCPRQCICQEHSIACSCEDSENRELIISSLGSTYITSLVIHTCDKVTISNASFSGVVLVERLSFIGIDRLFFEPNAFKDILQSPRQLVIEEVEKFRNSKIGTIAAEAFHFLTSVDYVYFRRTHIERIERRAFSKMYQIGNVYFKDAIRIGTIESEAFSGAQIDELVVDDVAVVTAVDTMLINVDGRSVRITNSSIYFVPRLAANFLEFHTQNVVEKWVSWSKCEISQSRLNLLAPAKFGCISLIVRHSQISKIDSISLISRDLEVIGENDGGYSRSLNSLTIFNSSIEAINSMAFSNYSMDLIVLNSTQIGRIKPMAFEKSKIISIVFENSKIDVIDSSVFHNSKIGTINFEAMDIQKISSEFAQNSSLNRLQIRNSNIFEIGANLFEGVRMQSFEICDSRVHEFDKTALYGKNEITSISITGSDVSTNGSSASLLSANTAEHPTRFTLANNTIDCASASCSINSFLLNTPKHTNLLWRVANNKCRPPMVQPCRAPKFVAHRSIVCSVRGMVAECACNNDGPATLRLDDGIFANNVSMLIIGDCDALRVTSSSTSKVTQLYIFRTIKTELAQLPASLRVLQVYHSSVRLVGDGDFAMNSWKLWHFANSHLERIRRIANLSLETLKIEHSRIGTVPELRDSRIARLIIVASRLESTESLFAVTRSLEMRDSAIFSTPKGLGTINSAQLQNNTLLECCRHPVVDQKCSIYFHGSRCEQESLSLAHKAANSKFSMILASFAIILVF